MNLDYALLQHIDTLFLRAKHLGEKLDLEKKKKQISELEQEMSQPDFWSDQDRAKKQSQELSLLKQVIESLGRVQQMTDDLKAYTDLAKEGEDSQIEQELRKLAKELEHLLDSLELETYFSGTYDQFPALLSIHSGQGGTEAMDWASMLQRMYMRYFERKEWKFEMLDESRGEEAGIKSCTFLVRAPFAYGYLKGEAGTHRLVRLSPFNADSLRQTSFSGVEVMPYIDDTDKTVELNPDDLDWEFTRAGGHGGQNVNKVNSAVVLTHKPTGIIVETREQRYQEQNRKLALSILKSKLAEIEEQKSREEMARVKGDHKIAGWGNQIRNYVLHPYHLVKDVRTQVETSDTESVLDGDLDQFIQAEIKLYS
jgi:peptide chain release factor 2